MKASLKCRYDVEKNGAAATVGVSAGDVKLRATLTDATLVNGPSLNGLSLAVEKPGSFIVDYNVAKNVRSRLPNFSLVCLATFKEFPAPNCFWGCFSLGVFLGSFPLKFRAWM